MMELIKIFENQEKASLWFTGYAKHNNFKQIFARILLLLRGEMNCGIFQVDKRR